MAQDIFGNTIIMLSSALSVRVFPDFVPESYTDPAVAVVNIANPFKRTVKEGIKTCRTGVFKLSVVAESNADVKSIIDELEALDNTVQSPYFQRIRLELDFIEPKEPGQPVRRAFVTLTVYL